jgi:hypothetical protein
MTTGPKFKVRENRARRAAQRQGLILKKNPRRDSRAADYGSYLLINPDSEWVEADFGWDRVGFPNGPDWLADVEAYLAKKR